MKYISSRSNPYVKYIRTLHTKKGRNKSGDFYIEGIRLVAEAFETNFPLQSVIICPEMISSPYGSDLIERISDSGIEIIEVTSDVFHSFALKDGPHGIAAVGCQEFFKIRDPDKLEGLWIALDRIQDPGNLGTILRSLDGAGGKGVFLIDETTDPFHPSAVRASTGAVFSSKIASVTTNIFISLVNENDLFCIGTVCDGGKSFKSVEYPKDMILLMGSEQKGLSVPLIDVCKEKITIPMTGRVDSLNLSNSASIVLFEIYTQGLSNG